MTTFIIDTQNAAPFAIVEAAGPREALAAMFADVGLPPDVDEAGYFSADAYAGAFDETWSKGPWAYRVGTPDVTAPADFTYFAIPQATDDFSDDGVFGNPKWCAHPDALATTVENGRLCDLPLNA